MNRLRKRVKKEREKDENYNFNKIKKQFVKF